MQNCFGFHQKLEPATASNFLTGLTGRGLTIKQPPPLRLAISRDSTFGQNSPKSRYFPPEKANHNIGMQRSDPFLGTVLQKSENHNSGDSVKHACSILFLERVQRCDLDFRPTPATKPAHGFQRLPLDLGLPHVFGHLGLLLCHEAQK